MCDVVGFSLGQTSGYIPTEFCMPAQCDSTNSCVNQIGMSLTCDGTMGNLTYLSTYYVCRCGSGTVSIPSNAATILGGPITSPITPQGCSGSPSPTCSSSEAQTCAFYEGSQQCKRFGCIGDCSSSSKRFDSAWNVYTCDNTVQTTGTGAYLCNCQGPVDKNLAQSITTADELGEGGTNTIGTCTNNATLPLPGAAQAVVATGRGVELSPVLLNADNLG